MPTSQKISRKLVRVLLIQLAFISGAVLLSVATARYVLGGILIQRALQEESEYFWQRFQADPECSLPDTHNMRSYLTPRQRPEQLPPEIRTLGDGYHSIAGHESFKVVQISSHAPARLFLVFDGHRVKELAFYFGMIPLTAGLIGVYAATLIGYRMSQKAVSPILLLAQQVDRIQRDSPDKSLQALEQISQDEDEEVRALSHALSRLSSRILQFIERERTFTRDVSHELRSPITVVRMASDVLLQDPALPEGHRGYVQRIKRAATDMEELTRAFLLLSREAEQGLPGETVCLNDVVRAEVERAEPLIRHKPVKVSMVEEERLLVTAPETVLAIMIGNLLRNACLYTPAGGVTVRIAGKMLRVEDTGPGMSEETVNKAFQPYFRGTAQGEGHGVGLSIVRRLSDRFGWPLTLSSAMGSGTTATVEFPQAVVDVLPSGSGRAAAQTVDAAADIGEPAG